MLDALAGVELQRCTIAVDEPSPPQIAQRDGGGRLFEERAKEPLRVTQCFFGSALSVNVDGVARHTNRGPRGIALDLAYRVKPAVAPVFGQEAKRDFVGDPISNVRHHRRFDRRAIVGMNHLDEVGVEPGPGWRGSPSLLSREPRAWRPFAPIPFPKAMTRHAHRGLVRFFDQAGTLDACAERALEIGILPL